MSGRGGGPAVRLGEVDDAADGHRDDRRDHPQAARPRAGLAVVALAEDVIIHRRTPVISPICLPTIRGRRRWDCRPILSGTETNRGITLSVSRSPREAAMDRNVLDVIERELDDAVRARFPGGAVRHVALLQYGDDPQIEPRDLWVRVLLDSDGPEDYEPVVEGVRGRPPGGDRRVPALPDREGPRDHERGVQIRRRHRSRRRPRRPPVRLYPPGGGCPTTRSGSAARLPLYAPRWDRPAWKRWTR